MNAESEDSSSAEDDGGVIDGYVLEAEPGFLHVLTDDREVIIVPDAEVHDRCLT